jgi:hypothetical protein
VPTFASENKNKSKNKNNNNKKITIMKTMQVTPMAVAKYEGKESVKKFAKAAKKFFAATVRFFIVISPAYPQYVESMRKKG